MKRLIFSLLFIIANINIAIAAPGDVTVGKGKALMCSACHGTDGNSLVPIYPKLAGQSASYIAKQLADFKLGAMSGGKEGRVDAVMGGMVMALSAQDMQDLGAYYSAQSISAGDGSVISAGEKLHLGGDAERGIAACASCHGKDGEGMKLAGFPSLAGQNSAYLKEQLKEFRSGVRANDKNKIMRDITFKLTDDDIAALMQHMSSLK